jgi:glucuronoarabinoxylan endo-1,4-beta-xylanase
MKMSIKLKCLIFIAVITGLIFSTCVSTSKVDTGEPNAVITVNVDTKYQYVRGFGGMEVGWGNFPRTSARDTELLFNPDTGLGLNILRIMIMPQNTDINVTMKALVSGDRPDYYENVKIVNKYGGYVLATPWSPPKEWKSNNDLNGSGRLNPKNYKDYANYLKSFAAHMREHGAPIYAISIQNEPNYEVSYDGCLWSPVDMRVFFINVGHFTDGVKGYGGGKEIPSVRTMNGESANTPSINDVALGDPDSREVIDIVGRHTYGDRLNRYARALDHPTDPKEVWMTEHNINSGNANGYLNDSTWNFVWKILNDIDLSIRINDESAFIWWAAKRFYGLMGDGQYDTENGELTPRGYAMSHYAKFAKETYRVGITATGRSGDDTRLTSAYLNSNSDNIDGTTARITAFVSPDGNTISLVMFTPTHFNGTDGINMGRIKIQLPADFIIGKAVAMRSKENSYAKWEDVKIGEDRTSAIVNLPRGQILSVRFTK